MSPESTPERPGINRRQFIPRATAGTLGLAVAGFIGYEIAPGGSKTTTTTTETTTTGSGATGNTGTAAASGAPAEYQSFLTRPDLRPPVIKITRPAGAAADDSRSPYILVSSNNVVQGGPVQQGLMVIDRQGRLIYFKPNLSLDEKPFDLNIQDHGGKPVLTWWQGHLVAAHGAGTGIIVGEDYQQVQQVQAGHGLQIDLHELNLTSRGTALITAYEEVSANLKSIGGSSSGKVWACHAQEIDLKTGKVLFDWNSLDHVGVDESDEGAPAKASQVLDYMHMNSVSETSDGNLLISGRNTSALYKVDRGSGKVIWRLGGKKSDFQVAADAQFQFQHHSRAWSETQYTVFDNSSSAVARSRGLLLDVDESTKQVKLTQQFQHPAAFWSQTLGSVSLLDDGHVFVGWGSQPYFSEFTADGTLILDGQFPINVRSYRAFTSAWSGHPDDKPTVVARQNPAGGFAIRVSWNGASKVARWNVMAGSSASSLKLIGSQEWTGFETAMVVNSQGPSFQVVALDAEGNELGRSDVL